MAIENQEPRIRRALAAHHDQQVADDAQLECLGGHASLRIYWRIHLPADAGPYPRSEATAVAMVLPEEEANRSEEGPADAASPGELPFLNMQRYLAALGMPVPEVDHYDADAQVLLLEDLGDETLDDAVSAILQDPQMDAERRGPEVVALYQQAIDLLLDFQEAVVRSMADEEMDADEDCIAFDREFDRELLRWELEHYVEWGLEAQHGAKVVEPHRAVFDAAFDRIVAELWDLLDLVVLRDYQSRNLMRKGGGWYIIDFQDALVGPYVYDLVALLRDSYVQLGEQALDALLDYYVAEGAARGLPWCGDADTVREAFFLQTVQRKLKDAGRFVYIDRVKDNPDFLEYYEPSMAYVRHALEQLPDFDDLIAALKDADPAF